jgi:hypothetical protein
MLYVELSLNVIGLLALMAVSAIAGYVLRNWHIFKIRAILYRLENEVLRSHAEILELQKQCLLAEQQLQNISKPVIDIHSISFEVSPF